MHREGLKGYVTALAFIWVNDINPFTANHGYSRFKSVLLAILITVIGNEISL